MTPSEHPLLVITLEDTAPANIARGLFVEAGGAIAGAGEDAVGVCHEDIDTGDRIPVIVKGVAIVVAGAAVAKGARVESNASGQAITLAAGVDLGKALTASTGAGQLIAVLLH